MGRAKGSSMIALVICMAVIALLCIRPALAYDRRNQ